MSQASATLSKIAAGQMCAGCGACAAIAPEKISLAINGEGFARPVQSTPLSRMEEEKLSRVCPSIGLNQKSTGVDDNPLWGPYREVYRGWANDPALRHHASSGGGLSALLVHLVQSGKVEHVVQVGADEKTPYANAAVKSQTAEEIFNAAGSRYAPSSPLAGIETHLNEGRLFAFVGKPCDVAALRGLAKEDDRIDRLVPYMISFFCAGVPSLKGAEEIIRTLGADPQDVATFRYRGDGWPGHAAATLTNGEVKKMTYHDSWGKILTKHLQPRCKVCPDGVGGFADIVFADAWHCDDKGYPLFDEQQGQSLIVTRTEKGSAILADAVEGGIVRAEKIDVREIQSMQPGQVKRKRLAFSRLTALRVLLRPTPRFVDFQLGKAARQAGVLANIKSFLGTSRRVVLGRW